MDPPVKVRALLQREVPPDVLEGAVPWNLLPSGYKASNVVGVRAQFFTFQISTFDKSRFPRALIIAWTSHHSPYPRVLLPPYDLHIKTNTDKNIEQD